MFLIFFPSQIIIIIICSENNKIEINTVDSFQGSECDIIIMSCVKSEGIGFVKDPNRLNVSLTRAKHVLILCGNFRTFRVRKFILFDFYN